MTGPGGPGAPSGGGGASSGSGSSGSGDLAQSRGPSVGNERRAPEIDVQRLADKVYRLFLADLSMQQRRSSGRKE
jgi:hypothetical protein